MSDKKKRTVYIVGIIVLLLSIQSVNAHPLGNFSVNRYSQLTILKDEIELVYIVDSAEIPALQNNSLIDRDENGTLSETELEQYAVDEITHITNHLSIEVDGKSLSLEPKSWDIQFVEGQTELTTERFEIQFVATNPYSKGQLVYIDGNAHDEQAGWKEIVFKDVKDLLLSNASIATQDKSEMLTLFPNTLVSPPNETNVSLLYNGELVTTSLPDSPLYKNEFVTQSLFATFLDVSSRAQQLSILLIGGAFLYVIIKYIREKLFIKKSQIKKSTS